MAAKVERSGPTQGGRASEQRAVGKTAPLSPDSSAEPAEQPLAVIVAPVGRGRFRAWLDCGPELVRSSSTPFLSACRKLLDLGYDAKRPAVMRHCGTNHDALRSTIGAAARLTVREDGGGPRFARLAPDAPPTREGSSSIAPTTSPVLQQPPASEPTCDGASRGRCKTITEPVAHPAAPATQDDAVEAAPAAAAGDLDILTFPRRAPP
jgi:hypothetical protein